MATTSRTAVLLEPGKVEIQEFALPKTGADDALMRVEARGVCASTHHFPLDETELALKIVARLEDEPAVHVRVVPNS